MVTEVDEGKGLVKTCWADVRDRVAKVEPTFAKIVDELDPDKTFPLYLAYYPYGDLIGDAKSMYLPSNNGGYYCLSDSNVPKDILKHLGYGKDSAPLTMVLEKQLEYFLDLRDERVSVPWLFYSEGMFFPFSRVLSRNNSRVYAANGILTVTSGIRSAFMLPNIGCATNHANLQRDFNVQSPPPKSLYEHWYVFKEIFNSGLIDYHWYSCALNFSERWIDKLYNDKAWLKLKVYFYEVAWKYTEYRRNNFSYDFAFSMIQKKRNLKPNPYLVDTAKHLFVTSLGAAPGYAPACNNDALPLDVLQKAYVESYGLKKYLPTILQATLFNFEESNFPVYYSLQHPSTHVFSPRSREVSSTLTEMRELEHIMRVFIDELGKGNGICSDTIMGKIANGIKFNYFHNKMDRHRIVQHSSNAVSLDQRFDFANTKYGIEGAKFPADAPFLRGCISIKRKSPKD